MEWEYAFLATGPFGIELRDIKKRNTNHTGRTSGRDEWSRVKHCFLSSLWADTNNTNSFLYFHHELLEFSLANYFSVFYIE